MKIVFASILLAASISVAEAKPMSCSQVSQEVGDRACSTSQQGIANGTRTTVSCADGGHYILDNMNDGSCYGAAQ